MTTYIVYPLNGQVALVMPTGEIPLQEVARKDVPAGIPYMIIEASDLPDPVFFDAWEGDFSSPHGYGIGHDAWIAEQEALLAAEEVRLALEAQLENQE